VPGKDRSVRAKSAVAVSQPIDLLEQHQPDDTAYRL
jgi:hypothetical protein